MNGRVVLVAGPPGDDLVRHLRTLLRTAGRLRDEFVLVAPRETLDAVGVLAGLRPVVLPLTARPGRHDPEQAAQLRESLRGAEVGHALGARAGSLAVLAARGLGRARPRLVVTLYETTEPGVGMHAVGLVLDTVVANGADVVLTTSTELLERERRLGSVRRGLERVTRRGVLVARAVVPVPRQDVGGAAPGPADVGPVRSELARRRAHGTARFLLDVAPTTPLVVTVDDLVPGHGVKSVVDAAAALASPRARWFVVGDGPSRASLEAEVAARGLADRVVLLGARNDTAQLLRAADVVVSVDGRALTLMAALDASAAVVATDTPGNREVLDGAARLVPAGDPAALAAAVDRLLADPLALTQRQRLARRRARRLPTEEDLVAQLRSVYARPSIADPPSLTEPDS